MVEIGMIICFFIISSKFKKAGKYIGGAIGVWVGAAAVVFLVSFATNGDGAAAAAPVCMIIGYIISVSLCVKGIKAGNSFAGTPENQKPSPICNPLPANGNSTNIPVSTASAAAAPQMGIPHTENGHVDMSCFSAEDRRLLDDSLTFMINASTAPNTVNECAKVMAKFSQMPGELQKGQCLLPLGDLQLACACALKYGESIPQLVEVNPLYKEHEKELINDMGKLSVLLLRVTPLLQQV